MYDPPCSYKKIVPKKLLVIGTHIFENHKVRAFKRAKYQNRRLSRFGEPQPTLFRAKIKLPLMRLIFAQISYLGIQRKHVKFKLSISSQFWETSCQNLTDFSNLPQTLTSHISGLSKAIELKFCVKPICTKGILLYEN